MKAKFYVKNFHEILLVLQNINFHKISFFVELCKSPEI
jgi:hypothetical protein